MPLPVQNDSILNTYLDVKDLLKLTAWPAEFILIQVDGGYCESVQALYSGNACAALTFSISKALNYQRGGVMLNGVRACVCSRLYVWAVFLWFLCGCVEQVSSANEQIKRIWGIMQWFVSSVSHCKLTVCIYVLGFFFFSIFRLGPVPNQSSCRSGVVIRSSKFTFFHSEVIVCHDLAFQSQCNMVTFDTGLFPDTFSRPLLRLLCCVCVGCEVFGNCWSFLALLCQLLARALTSSRLLEDILKSRLL